MSWKRAVKTYKFAQASTALIDGLFSFVPPLRLAITEIRKECLDVERRRLFAVGQEETITLETFLEQQLTMQHEVAQVRAHKLEHKADNHIISVVVAVLDDTRGSWYLSFAMLMGQFAPIYFIPYGGSK